MDSVRAFLSFLLDIVLPEAPDEKRVASLTLYSLGDATRAEPCRDTFLFAPLSYRDENVRALIWTLKYRGRRESAELLAEVLAEHMLEGLSEKQLFGSFREPLLVPMPLAKGRRRERGFNQSEILAEALAPRISATLSPRALTKIKETPPQTRLAHRSEREKNLSGAFLGDESARGRDIILLDDVITTGSSMKEARRELLRAGARDVWCVAVAH